MAFLRANNGPQRNQKFDLAQTNVLGRHPECQIVIDVGAVSRHHAQISLEAESFFVEDLNSRNGTYVNDRLLEQRQPLNHGDQIRVCDVAFTFHADQSPINSGESSSSNKDGSSFGTILVDDESDSASSTIMSKLDVSSHRKGAQIQASPEAKLAALIEITQNLGKAISLDEVLPQVLTSLFKIFIQADRGFVVLRDENDNLVPRWTEVRRKDTDDTIRISRTIVNQVMDSQEAVLSADAASDERFEMSQSIADFRIRSMMCAPLVDSDENSLGVIQIDTLDQRKRFQAEDLEVLVGVAGQAAIAIDNAQMHENALAQREVERDLQLATDVQRGFLPQKGPDIGGYNFFEYYKPANHIGGDYFDYIQLPDGKVAVIVADVVGHGIAAALMMAKLSAEAKFSLASIPQPGEAISRLNNTLSTLPTDRFVTLIMGVLDPKTHEMVIVNSGHMAPLIRHSDGTIVEPGEDEAGPPLGIIEGMEYEQVTIQLQPGDTVAMYTDGLNEAMDEEDQCYGIERIRDIVNLGIENVGEMGNRIIEDVVKFVGSGPQTDDMCLVCLRRYE